MFECLDRTWRSNYCYFGGSVNISNFISNSNHLTNFVSYFIVREPDIKRRKQIIQYFIDIACSCRNLNNFSSMTAIVSAMFSSPIYRLKQTWALVSKSYKEKLNKLNMLMDSTKNFSRYREVLDSIHNVPCVPFFGVYLSDLTFTAGGNPDFLDGSSDIINFGKRARIVTVLREIGFYQCQSYNIKCLDDVQEFLKQNLANVPNIEKQYEQSLFIEPRTKSSAGLDSSYSRKRGYSTPFKGRKFRFASKRGSKNENLQT